MKILVLNPNSTTVMNQLIQQSIPDTRVKDAEVICPSDGPAAIETSEDEVAAVDQMIAKIADLGSRVDEFDVLVVACYGDPGLEDIESLVQIPVVGIAQTSMAVAFAISEDVGLIVALPSAVPIMSNLAKKYGHNLRADAIEASGVPVLGMLYDPEISYPAILAAAERLRNKGVDTICLGCASMGQFATRLKMDTGLVIIDAMKVTEGVLQATRRSGH